MSSSGNKLPPKASFNARKITAPLAAFTMACLLFVYARSSIQAAKRNAQSHREADGGQISWRNESLRRHGQLEIPGGKDGTTTGKGGDGLGAVVRELLGTMKKDGKEADGGGRVGETLEERRVREIAAGGLGRKS